MPVVSIDSSEIQILTDTILSALRGQPEKEITSILLKFKSRDKSSILKPAA
jgi:hypothetical protein